MTSRYRIVEKQYDDGSKEFVPQRKSWIFWVGYTHLFPSLVCGEPVVFESFDEAVDFLSREKGVDKWLARKNKPREVIRTLLSYI